MPTIHTNPSPASVPIFWRPRSSVLATAAAACPSCAGAVAGAFCAGAAACPFCAGAVVAGAFCAGVAFGVLFSTARVFGPTMPSASSPLSC